MDKQIQIAPDRPTLVHRLRSAWQGWYAPSAPLPPVAPEGTEPRQFDFPLMINQQWMPRSGEKIGFHQLRMMADGCYLIRVLIEKMKDRIATKEWHFRLRPKAGEYSAHTKERSNNDPRVQALTTFFQRPDSTHSWEQWIRMLLEDRLVIDAATLEVQRTKGGDILNLLPVDGATINVLIDNTGRRPMYPDPAYRQIVKGLPAVDFTSRDLVYMPANVRNHKLYGYSPVEQTLALILTLVYKTVMHQDWYDESNVPLAYMTMPENMSTAEMLRLVREIEASNSDLSQRTKILPVPFGGKIELIKHENYQNAFEQWAARVFAFILGETATPFIDHHTRAIAQQTDETREESGEQPLMHWVKNEIDSIVQRPDLFNGPDIEFVWNEVAETDAMVQAQIDQITVAIGTRVADELRQRDGLSPLWEASGGNPPKPSPLVLTEETKDEPGAAGNDESGNSDDTEGTDGDPNDGPNRPPPPPKTKNRLTTRKAAEASKKNFVTISHTPTFYGPKRRAATDRIEASLKVFFAGQRVAVGRVIGNYLPDAKKAAGDQSQPNTKEILAAISWSAWNKIVDELEPGLSATGLETVANVFATLNVSPEGSDLFNLSDTQARDYARERGAEMVGKKWVDGELVDNPNAKWAITDTTREGLRQLIVDAFEQQWTPTELAREIDASFVFSPGRAEMIARTETAMAQAFATVQTGKNFGAKTKSCQMSNLHDIDDQCDAAAAAGEIPIDKPYPDGVMHIPLHPRCMCVELVHVPRPKKEDV